MTLLPRVWVGSLAFSDGTTLPLGQDDVVLIVGPNNSGKSAALRAIRDKVTDSARLSPVVSSLTLKREGEVEDVSQWLEEATKANLQISPGDPVYQLFGAQVNRSQVSPFWAAPHLFSLARFFCHLLNADERLRAANPAPAIALARDPPSHPIHFLQRDDSLELRLSAQFRKAFGVDLVVHRNAGAQVPLYTGDRPKPKDGQDRVSREYVKELEKLPTLENQGDGMRSFAGVLLEASVGRESMLLIDEPEAFLHPPQARQLGRMLAAEKSTARQLFLATHSGDFLRGVLDGDSKHVTVVRIRREGDVNPITQLDNARLRSLWSDPLLRYSNVLDGLFHEAVVVTESDSDARFYAAVGDAVFVDDVSDGQKPDVMFTHGGGKSRVPLIVKSLRGLGVPVRAVTDFDVLNDEHTLVHLVEASGGNWDDLKADWKAVKEAVDSKKPQLSSAEVKKELLQILDGTNDQYFPQQSKRSIENVLRRSSPWAQAKATGRNSVPSGTVTQACDRLLRRLCACGIFLVECGELESFAQSVGGHGRTWVNEIIKKDLKADPELEGARQFVRRLFAPFESGKNVVIQAAAAPLASE